MKLPRIPTASLPGLATLFAGAVMVLALTGSAALAMPPAQGLSGSEAAKAERVLERAQKRGVGSLPASPFTRSTPCGRAGKTLRMRMSHRRRAMVQLRRAVRARSGSTAAARKRLRAWNRAVRISSARRARICAPTARRVLRDPEHGRLAGTVTTERPRSVVAGRAMVVALPVDFADAPARRSVHAPARYDSMLFGSDYPHGGGSLSRYFRDMSYGAFDVAGEVAAWRRMPGRRSSYAGDSAGMGSYPRNSQMLLEDAVAVHDRTVDFSRFDNDGPDGRPNSGDDDGFVDSVFLVYAGTSAAENGELDTIWPHAWRHAVATRDRSANGGYIKVDRYAAVPERMQHPGPDGDLLTVGVVAHEYGHVLGLPDLVDGSRAGHGPGAWDLMGTGLWGFKHSSRPTGLSSWSRARLGWLTPRLLQGDHPGHQLGSSYAQRTTVKLPVAGKPLHEHFLVERRTREGFDADLPGDGTLVWHIDDSRRGGGDTHPRVELVAADGSAGSDAGDLLQSGARLSSATEPRMRAHDGEDSLVAVQNVTTSPAYAVDLHAGAASLAPAIDAEIEQAGPQAAPPTATLEAPLDGARIRGLVTLSCSASGGPKVNQVQFLVDGAAVDTQAVNPAAGAITLTYDWSSTTVADGGHTLGCRSRNTSNQWSAVSSASVTVDNTVPGTPVSTTPADGAWLRGTVSHTVTGTDNYGVTGIAHVIDGIASWQGPWPEATPQASTLAWDTTTTTDGAHTLAGQSVDLAGNESAVSAPITVRVDNTAPSMAAPRDGSGGTDIQFQSSATSLAATWVAADDGTGSGIASYLWRFCTTTACGTVLASGSGTTTSAAAAGLSLADAGTYFACVRPVDAVGNQGTEACSDGVTVDAVPPAMSTPTDGAAAPDIDFQASTTGLDATWAAATDAGSGMASYEWRFCTTTGCATVLASGTGTGTSATAAGLSLTDGTTLYACVRATDRVGNASAYTCSDGVTVDTSAPTMSVPNDGPAAPDIDSQPSATTLDANWAAGADGTGSGVAAYDWRFCTTTACATVLASGNGAAASAAATGLSLTSGNTYFACARATDQVGNIGAWSCSDGVTVTPSAPTVTISSPAAGESLGGSHTVTASAQDTDGITKVEYLVDGVLQSTEGPFAATNPKASSWVWDTRLSAVPDGPHTIEVRAWDGVSDVGSATVSIVVDNTAPAASHGGITAGSTVTGPVTFSSSSSDAEGVTSVDYLVDGTAHVTTTTTASATFTDAVAWDSATVLDGNHAYRVSVRDAAGNVTHTSPVTLFVVHNNGDITPPGGALDPALDGATLTGTASLTTSATDDNAVTKVEFLVGGTVVATDRHVPAGWTGGSRSRSWGSTSMANGTYTLTARITDAGGNVTTTPGVQVTVSN